MMIITMIISITVVISPEGISQDANFSDVVSIDLYLCHRLYLHIIFFSSPNYSLLPSFLPPFCSFIRFFLPSSSLTYLPSPEHCFLSEDIVCLPRYRFVINLINVIDFFP